MSGVYYMYLGAFSPGDVPRVLDFPGLDKLGPWLYFCSIRNGQISHKMSLHILHNIPEKVTSNIYKTILLYQY